MITKLIAALIEELKEYRHIEIQYQRQGGEHRIYVAVHTSVMWGWSYNIHDSTIERMKYTDDEIKDIVKNVAKELEGLKT